jgi:predicted GNAT family acetyltransferase
MTADPHPASSGDRPGRPAVTVTDNLRAERFELRVGDEFAGYATYRDVAAGRAFEHTVIAAEFEGRGLASDLIRFVLDEASFAERRVLPFCPFVRLFIQRHPDYLTLVDQPERFGLTP